MNTNELIRNIFIRLGKLKWLIVCTGLIFGVLMYFYAKSKPVEYTAKATLFPLTTPTDNSLSQSALNGILGLGDAPKSFSTEATINIIELAMSRHVRQAVAGERLPAFNNKLIAELVIDNANDNMPFYSKKIKMPADSQDVVILGGELLQPDIGAKMSKNGVLEFYLTSTNKKLVTPLANVIIEQLSKFYIDLKVKKATADYAFAVNKIDSLQQMIDFVDRKAVNMQNTTFFTPDRLEYALPKDNLSQEKNRILRQRDLSVNNREEATWRLQKATPIIAVLDKPTEPFTEARKSGMVFAVIGILLGSILGVLIAISGLIYRFAKAEIHRNIFGNNDNVSVAS